LEGDDAVFNLLGYGLPDVARALESEDNRVILFAEDTLATDKFAVYEVPIPDVFQTKGARQIRVALSFDPPVRHTRLDYADLKWASTSSEARMLATCLMRFASGKQTKAKLSAFETPLNAT
jgi:hypothetical protein